VGKIQALLDTISRLWEAFVVKKTKFYGRERYFEESTDQTSLFDVNPSPWISKQPVAVKRKWLLPKQLTAKARRFCAPGYVIVS
jgi:hypothetical protein